MTVLLGSVRLNDMKDVIALPKNALEDEMRFADVSRVSAEMADVLADTGEENLVYLSAMVPPSHKELIKSLARVNRTSQAVVLRTIIDEWCEGKAQNNGSPNGGAV